MYWNSINVAIIIGFERNWLNLFFFFPSFLTSLSVIHELFKPAWNLPPFSGSIKLWYCRVAWNDQPHLIPEEWAHLYYSGRSFLRQDNDQDTDMDGHLKDKFSWMSGKQVWTPFLFSGKEAWSEMCNLNAARHLGKGGNLVHSCQTQSCSCLPFELSCHLSSFPLCQFFFAGIILWTCFHLWYGWRIIFFLFIGNGVVKAGICNFQILSRI